MYFLHDNRHANTPFILIVYVGRYPYVHARAQVRMALGNSSAAKRHNTSNAIHPVQF